MNGYVHRSDLNKMDSNRWEESVPPAAYSVTENGYAVDIEAGPGSLAVSGVSTMSAMEILEYPRSSEVIAPSAPSECDVECADEGITTKEVVVE